MLLLAASYYFYLSWSAKYFPLLLLSTYVDYWAGLKMGGLSEQAPRKKYLYASLFINLGMLFAFKYFNLFNDAFANLASAIGIPYDIPALNLLLPIGISFYTFQTLSYSIDVYRGRRAPERHLGYFALYVSFFPQLIAGPIERSDDLIPQLQSPPDFDYDRVVEGCRRMAWGFFKKLVIADRLALLVNWVYDNPHDYSSLPLLIATYAFAFQIYCDFAGYCDIAIGAAGILGVRLKENFNRPYAARSIPDFWKRWHITLSSWLHDYLYIPLGGNRCGKVRQYLNIAIVFLLAGLWHGASWTFVIWGGLHAVFYLCHVWTAPARAWFVARTGLERTKYLLPAIQIAITFHISTFARIFFRANSADDGFFICRRLFDFSGASDFLSLFRHPELVHDVFGVTVRELQFVAAAILLMEFVHWLQRRGTMARLSTGAPAWLRWAGYFALLWLILNFGMFQQPAQFYYYQF